MTGLPDFIVQNPPLGDPQAPPPFRFEDVDIQMFQVAADGVKLEAICDYFINDFAAQNNYPFRIHPLLGSAPGIVHIELLRYGRMYSTAPGHEQLGYSSQHELMFSIPVVFTNLIGIPLAVGMFVPHICVDEAFSMITGREVVGFPKVDAEFEMPAEVWDVDGCVVSALAAQPYSPSSPIEFKPLLETKTTVAPLMPFSSDLLDSRVNLNDYGQLPGQVARPLWPYGPIDELYGRDSQFAVDPRVRHLLEQSAGIGLTSYSLKQFRDAEVPDKACYQALVEASTSIHQFGSGGLLPPTEITIHEYASIEIIQQLGLDTQGSTINPLFGIWYKADFTMTGLKNLATRCGGQVGQPYPPHNCVQIWATSARSVLGLYKSMAEACIRAIDSIDPGGNDRDQ